MSTVLLLACLPVLAPAPQGYACSDFRARVVQGQPGPESGLIAAPSAPFGATMAADGRTAFVARIDGPARNQAVVISDGQSLRAIAVGCGGPGGGGNPGTCGDSTPLGGTYAGFFTDPFYAPATNDAGDVLFLADVFGGTSPRALFLYRSAANAIVSVAAFGDISPSGGTIGALGSGSFDPNGGVVFLARTGAGQGPANEVLSYDAGALALVAGVGSAGPGGSTISDLGGEFQLCADGTEVLTGPMPARDGSGRVAFFAYTLQTQVPGLVLGTPGQPPVWIATWGQPAPGGGAFSMTFYGPSFAPNGEVVFSARYSVGASSRVGVFIGTPGALRRVLSTSDVIGSSICIGLERSRNPFAIVGSSGEIVLWARIQRPDLSQGDVHLVAWPNGMLEVLAESGLASPFGGTIAELGHFPSIDAAGRVLESARIDFGSTTHATWIREPCGTPTAFCQGKPSSLGCTPRIDTQGRASATSSAPFLVTADSLPSRRRSILFYGLTAGSVPFQGGTLCVAGALRRTAVQMSSGPVPSDCTGTLSLDFGARITSGVDPLLAAGTTIAAQWLVRDPLDPQGFSSTLSDATLFTIAP